MANLKAIVIIRGGRDVHGGGDSEVGARLLVGELGANIAALSRLGGQSLFGFAAAGWAFGAGASLLRAAG
jgi:hypothetical protein